jgi:tripartite-type tricarboxylate transporter receptor subunit TctC
MKKLATIAALSLLAFAAPAMAQGDFPNKVIQVVVGFAAGGSTDVVTRVLAAEVKRLHGWEVIVLNKPGASGVVGAVYVVSAPPDGYTLGLATSNSFTTAPFFQEVPADLLERTAALVATGRVTNALIVKGDSPYRTLKDLIENARRNPGQVSIALAGVGTNSSLVVQLLALDAKVNFTLVPFTGEALSANALLGGHVTAAALSTPVWGKYVEGKTMRVLSSMYDERYDAAPDAPTLIEQGYPYSAAFTYCVFGPKGLPPALAKRLADAFGEAARSPAYLDMAQKTAIDMKKLPAGDALQRFLVDEYARTGAMVEKLGIRKK